MSAPARLISAAGLALSLLWLAALVVLDSTHHLLKQSHIAQLQARLDLTEQLLEHWQLEHLNNVRSLSKLTWVQNWAAQQLSQPYGSQTPSQAYSQLRQLYLQQGYHGHALFDGTPLLRDDASDGSSAAVELPQETLEVLHHSMRHGLAISKPFPAPLNVPYTEHAANTLVHLVCARLNPELGEGNLCLHFDQSRGLGALLAKASHAQTGSFAVLDQQGQPLTPLPHLANSALRLGYQEHSHAGLATFSQLSQPLQLQLVLSVPLETLYAPYQLGRLIVLSLAGFASVLIVCLLLLALRNRHTLANREALYQQILNQLPLQVRVRDLAGFVQLENQRAKQSAYPIAKDLPLHASCCPLPELSQKSWQLQRAVKRDAQQHETQIMHGDYSQDDFYALRLVGFPIFDRQHKLRALGSLAIEQTDSIRSQQALTRLTQALEQQVHVRTLELAEARDAAESAARAKADFLANMSHEIRSPLSAVLGLAYLAERSNQDPRVGAYLQRIVSAAGHLQEMLNDILDFSKFEAGKLTLERIAFSPERLLESIADMVWDKAQRKNLSIVFDLDPKVPEQLYGDPLRLSQILLNLADNAIKFTAQGMVAVRIRALAHEGVHWQLCCEVQDSGIGIPTADIEQMFQPFEQLEQSTARQHGGTGLGLPICRQLAKLMHAELEARSQPGLGSLFSLTLRLEQVSEQLTPYSSAPGSRRALIIDAKAPSRDSLGEKLAALGLHVSHAASAQEAYAALHAASEPYHWLFIDWDLPDAASHDFAASLAAQQLAPHSQCVLLSGRGTSRLLPPEVLQHFSAVLDKPVSPLKLRETVLRLDEPGLPSLAGHHVLLVEDEALNQEVAEELLAALKLKVTVAEDGEKALACLAGDESIELVLLDMHLPVLDGLSTMARLRPLYPHLPVIALTGHCLPGDRERYLAAGMQDYLAKPFQPEALGFLLKRWLSQALPTKNPSIAGLNQSQALERLLGNQALYQRLLYRFCHDYKEVAPRLAALLEQEDYRQAGELIHSFKSVAATLGAEAIDALLQQIELELRQGLCVKTHVAHLGHALAQLFNAIEQHLPAAPSQTN